MNPELERTIEAVMERLGPLGQTLERAPKRTVVPARQDTASELGALIGTYDEALSAKLELHGTLGEGGMGRVRLGTQRSLARAVAVKTIKDEHRSDRATLKLLREAWITGNLEHPNIVPVYDVALDADGSPQVVLKRIEGTSWDRLIADDDAVRERFGASDALEWHLSVLAQVCNAVHFAHSRGILHRDLKPENVMIGGFGEVYLVDWGIAVATRDELAARMPLARESIELAGTPAYMAPEMLGGRVSRLSERSDIYLLGSILYEILERRPPHQGDSLMAMVAEVLESNPSLGPDVPPPLRRIVRRCMDPEPDGRFETAEQVRLALQGYLRHRDAIRLADAADTRREKLEGLLEDETPARDEAYRRFAEVRFGYRQALEVYSGHEPAREGLRAITERMARFELAQDEPESAHALLNELAEPPRELVVEVERARAEKQAENKRLQRMRDDLDPSTGRRTRAFIALIIGSIWAAVPGGFELALHFGWTHEATHLGAIVADVGFLVLLGGLFVWARESMTRTVINRRMALAAALAIVAQLVLNVVDWITGVDVESTFRGGFLVWAAIVAMAAASVDKKLWIPALTYGVAFVVLAFIPESVYRALLVCNAVLFVTMVTLWGRLDDVRVVRKRLGQRVRGEPLDELTPGE